MNQQTKHITPIKYSLVLLCSSFMLLTGCDYTHEPQFVVSRDAIKKDVDKIIPTVDLDIRGYKTPLNDTFDIHLTIRLINPESIPTDSNSAYALQKQVAMQVKRSLKDQSQFKAYDLIFLQRDTIHTWIGTQSSEAGLFLTRFNAEAL